MINSRNVGDLRPRTAAKASAFVNACAAAGIDIIITSTYRDDEAQEALYAQGRSKPGKKVTNVRGGYSFHNYRVAFDFVPVVGGKAQWDDVVTWQRCGAFGRGVGLEWGGDWEKFKDMPHMQDTGGFAIEAYKAGKVKE